MGDFNPAFILLGVYLDPVSLNGKQLRDSAGL